MLEADFYLTAPLNSVKKGGRVEIIANDQGNRITPSWVSFSPTGERLIGDVAKHAFHTNPLNTVYDAKRLIGRNFADEDVQRDMVHWPFNVVNHNGKPSVRVTHKNQLTDFVSVQFTVLYHRATGPLNVADT